MRCDEYEPEYELHRDPLGHEVQLVLDALSALGVVANDGDVAVAVAADYAEGYALGILGWAGDCALRYCAERGVAPMSEVG